MVQHDDEIVFEPSDELIERVAKRARQRKPRNRLHHILRTAQGKATYTGPKGHQRKPSLPKIPWDKET